MSREQLIGLIAVRRQVHRRARGRSPSTSARSRPAKASTKRPSAPATSSSRPRSDAKEIADLAQKHGLTPEALQAFVDTHPSAAMIFDGEQLTDLLAPLDLGWRARTRKGTGPDGRPRPAAEEARRRPGHLGPQRVRGVRHDDEGRQANTLMPKLRFPEFRNEREWDASRSSDSREPITERVGTTDHTVHRHDRRRSRQSDETFGRDYRRRASRTTTCFGRTTSPTTRARPRHFSQGFVARSQATRSRARRITASSPASG